MYSYQKYTYMLLFKRKEAIYFNIHSELESCFNDKNII